MFWVRWKCSKVAGAAVLLLATICPVRAGHAQPVADHASLSPEQVGGEPARSTKAGADLARCLDLADRNHPNILVSRAKLRQVRAQLREAYFLPFSQFRAVGGVALAPTLRGSNVFSPNTNVSLTSSLGVAWQATVSGVVPLWTFGKIANGWEAAEAGVEVSEHTLDMTRDAVRYDVRKAYYGLQLARQGLQMLDDAQKRIDEAVANLKRQVDEEDADPIELLKLKTFATELDVRRAEAEKGLRVAQAGLRYYTGKPDLAVAPGPLRPGHHKLGHLARYLRAARLHRPEVHMAKAGLAAREAQVAFRRSQLFPDVGIGLNLGVSAAPEIADQINPYVNDPGNFFLFGAALVFQWQLDILPAVARIDQAKAQLDEVRALDQQAHDGVAAEVEEAYAEVVDWHKRRRAYQQAERYSRQWLVSVQQAIDIGTMDSQELVDPAKAYALNQFNVLNATMQLNLAMAKLAKVTGWDDLAPKR